jgi:hypothetical protein
MEGIRMVTNNSLWSDAEVEQAVWEYQRQLFQKGVATPLGPRPLSGPKANIRRTKLITSPWTEAQERRAQLKASTLI